MVKVRSAAWSRPAAPLYVQQPGGSSTHGNGREKAAKPYVHQPVMFMVCQTRWMIYRIAFLLVYVRLLERGCASGITASHGDSIARWATCPEEMQRSTMRSSS